MLEKIVTEKYDPIEEVESPVYTIQTSKIKREQKQFLNNYDRMIDPFIMKLKEYYERSLVYEGYQVQRVKKIRKEKELISIKERIFLYKETPKEKILNFFRTIVGHGTREPAFYLDTVYLPYEEYSNFSAISYLPIEVQSKMFLNILGDIHSRNFGKLDSNIDKKIARKDKINGEEIK